MSLDLSHVAVHQLVVGLSGKGKSTLVRELAAKHPAPWKFAFETFKREYSSAPPHGLGWARCIDDPQMRAAVVAGKPSAFFSAPLFPGNRIEGFEFWASWVASVGKQLKGGKLLVIEEFEKTTAHENCPLAPAFAEILDELRGHKFDVIMAAQRISTVSRIVRSQTTDLCTFQHVEPCELDALQRQGFDVAAVERLQRGQFIWRQRETGKVWAGTTRPATSGRKFHSHRETTGKFKCKSSITTPL